MSDKSRLTISSDRIRTVDVGQGFGDGYGIPTAASLAVASLFGRHEALVLEQTYVAKTFAGLLDGISRKIIPTDEPVCILQTGGTPSIFEQT